MKSDHERQKEQHAAGGGGGASGFDTGRSWGSSIPKVYNHHEKILMEANFAKRIILDFFTIAVHRKSVF